MTPSFSYSKEEKLKSRKQVEQLFAAGKSFAIFPIKVFYMEIKEPVDFPIKVGVGVSSRYFKKAVDRNRVKRLLRENYRVNKLPLHTFITANNKQVALFFLYTDKVLPSFELLQQKMPLVINKLLTKLHENITANS